MYIKSLPTHKIPDYYTDDASLYIETSLLGWDVVYDRDQEKACRAVWDGVVSLFQPYAEKTNPFENGFTEPVP